jgi:hypothetical protein
MSVDDFLSNLGDALDQQFYTGENKVKSANLGSFANKYDRSAQRSYTEQGYFRNHFGDATPKQLDILLQEPEATILVKKRAFASLAENFRPDLMDKDERIFLLATKTLFQNKCKQISNYEKLTKIAQISTQIGEVDYHLLPILFGAVDALDAVGVNLGKFKDTVNRVRRILAFNTDARYTTWQSNPSNTNGFGEGTGVIEFTTAMDFSTTTGLQFGQGRFNINFSDPYNIMTITSNDIETAISSANNALYNNKGFQLLTKFAEDTLEIQKGQLSLERASRNVNPIRFILEPGTLVSKRIRAIIDVAGIEINFNISSGTNLFGSAAVDSAIDSTILLENPAYNKEYGEQGLSKTEAKLFVNIVSAMYNQLSLTENSKRRAVTSNSDKNNRLNVLRQKLRLHYMNKLIIQPMDSISIFVNSKKKLDSKITGGLQSGVTGLKLMQGISDLTQNIKDALNVNAGYSVEKSIFVGSDFPTPLWLALRSQFVADKQGACIFTGIFEQAISRYSNGGYQVSASGGDNAKFFEHGIVNINPSMDVYNGVLFDPLTPFDLKYDTVSGVETGIANGKDPELLSENKQIFKSVFVKNNNGPLAGSVPTEAGYFNRVSSNIPQPIKGKQQEQPFYDPEGLVYRWKQGIASLVLFGDSYQPGAPRGQSLTEDPFSGQDIMNVLSLLITGEPYNYATYYQGATKTGTLSRDFITNQTSAVSYFRGLRADIKNKNAIYGNFIPFKLLTMDEASFEKIMGSQLTALKFDSDLRKLTEERAALADKMAFLAPDSTAVAGLRTAMLKYDTAIQEKITSIHKEINNKDNPPIKVIGNDISYDYTDFKLDSKLSPTVKSRRELRKKIKFLTRRLAWKVRANEDVNLFIVDDTYDKDYDIQAFEQSFANLSIFKSDYTTVSQQIISVADKLKLEVFCNTQGHIEIRNPKYNRMPSSVFYKMLQQKDETGIQVFPQFLEDLFITQISDVYKRIEILEDRIRLYCFALGKTDDGQATQLINSTIGESNVISGGNFSFLSDTLGSITKNVTTVKLKADPTYLDGVAQQLNSQANLAVFGSTGRAQFIQSGAPAYGASNQFKSLTEIQSLAGSTDRFQNIKDRLASRTGEVFNIEQEFGATSTDAIALNSKNLAVLQITNKIAQLLSDREQAIKSAANALKNLKEGLSLDKKSGQNNLLFPSLSKSSDVPQMFEHMIEDESYDDIGVGSSKRYVLKNRDIVSYQINETKPVFTAVNVVGTFDLQKMNLPAELAVIGTNGNAMASATAVDYDLWRMYGISLPQQVDAPFLHDPASQLAPYAVSILNKARKEVLQGEVSIVGNEYQQPGEVVYIEDRDLLFYVDSVSHTFNYGKSFSTSMQIKYGHNPGEYIPTPLDVIGKVLYKNNKILPNLSHKRQGNVFRQENLGAVAVNLLTTTDLDIFLNQLAETNRAVLDQVITQAATTLSLATNDFKPILELRIYHNSQSQFNSVNPTMESFANKINDYILGGPELSGESTPPGKEKNLKRLMNFKGKNQVVVQPVDSSPAIIGEYRYPSRKAFYLAKTVLEKKPQGKDDPQAKIDGALHNHIIDFWITFGPTKK